MSIMTRRLARSVPSQAEVNDLPWEEIQRRQELLRSIENLPYAGVNNIAPHATLIPPEGETILAQRDTGDISQKLFAIIQAGTHGLALSRVYTPGLPREGHPYVTLINEDPHSKATRLLEVLHIGVPVVFGGKSPANTVPELSREGHDITVRLDKNAPNALKSMGEMRITSRRPVKVITAISSFGRPRPVSPLDQEVGIWAPPPDYVVRAIKRVTRRR